MSPKRLFLHGVILLYLAVTALALVYTLFLRTPLWSWPVVSYAVGMMAPYAGYQEEVGDLIAEGIQADGSRVQIDLEPYYPYLAGETNFRRYLRFKANPEHLPKYRSLALQLKNLEAKKGNAYDAIELFWEEWPASPDSTTALHSLTFTKRTFLLRAP